MLARMRGNGTSHSWLAGMQNGAAAFQDGLLISFSTKHALAMQSSNHTPCFLPKVTENLCPHKNPHVDMQPYS